MTILTVILLIISTIIWGFLFFKIISSTKNQNLVMRGIIKKYQQNVISLPLRDTIRIWFINLWIHFFLAWFLFSVKVLHSDYSFLAGFFPFVWYYFFLRYFLWEKDDLV